VNMTGSMMRKHVLFADQTRKSTTLHESDPGLRSLKMEVSPYDV